MSKKKTAKKNTEAKEVKEAKKPLTEKEKEELRKQNALRIMVAGVFILALSVFSAACLFFSDSIGTVGTFLDKVLRGLFGFGCYFFPLFLIAVAIDMMTHANAGKIRPAVLGYFLVLILICNVFQMIAMTGTDRLPLSVFYQSAKNGEFCGGVFGGLLSYLLFNAFGIVGLTILYAALLVVSGVLLLYSADDKEEPFLPEQPKQKPYVAPAPAPAETPKKITFAPPKKDKRGKLEKLLDEEPVAEAPVELPKQVTKKETEKAAKEVAVEIAKAQSKEEGGYVMPPLSLLQPNNQPPASLANIDATFDLIINKLQALKINAVKLGYTSGPSVTRFEIGIPDDIRVAKIAGMSDDIAMAVRSMGQVRIEAPIPGKAAIGIEIANNVRKTVTIREVVESRAFQNSNAPLLFTVGQDIEGNNIVGDLAKMPHMLVAGTTGSGKSIYLHSIIMSTLYHSTPDEVRMILFDPKNGVEFSVYNGIPNLLIPVVSDSKKAAGALAWAVGEMEKRYVMFSETGAKDIDSYNAQMDGSDEHPKIPRIMIIMDELNDMMMVAKKEAENSIIRLAQKARAAGIHMVLATQYPTTEVISNIIKQNIPARTALMVKNHTASTVIIDQTGAEKLMPRGDLLYCPSDAKTPVRIQGCLVKESESKAVADFIREHNAAHYDDSVSKSIDEIARGDAGGNKSGGSFLEETGRDDPMLEKAIEIAVESGQVSTTNLQRRLSVGFSRAGKLMDIMAERGIIGPYNGSKPREVLITKDQWMEMQMRGDTTPATDTKAEEEAEIE